MTVNGQSDQGDSPSATRCTRRQFMMSQWFSEDGAADESRSAKGDAIGRCRPAVPELGQAVAFVLLVITVAGALIAGIGVVGASHSLSGDVTPQRQERPSDCADANSNTVTRAQDRVNSLQSELTSLKSKYPSLVDDEIVAEVKHHVNRGEQAKALGRYTDACQAFGQAVDQARSALRLYYKRTAIRNLNAVDQLVTEAEDGPPQAPDSELVSIRQRYDRLQNQTAAADTLVERRQAHESAHALRKKAEQELPPTLLEQAAAHVNELLLGLTLFFGVTTVSLAAYVLRKWLAEQTGTTGPDPY